MGGRVEAQCGGGVEAQFGGGTLEYGVDGLLHLEYSGSGLLHNIVAHRGNLIMET